MGEKIKKVVVSTDQLSKDKEIALVHFNQGSYLSEEDSMKNISYFCDKGSDSRPFKRKILVVDNDNGKYVASNYGPHTHRQNSLRLYMGILNKKTKKMRIVNAESFDLKPVATIGHVFTEEKVEENAKTGFNEWEELTRSFGSLKKQRAMEARIKYKVSADSISQVMEKAINNVNVDEIQEDITNLESIKQSNECNSVPPINRNASKVEDVYNLQNLILISDDQSEEWEEASSVFIEATNGDMKTWAAENKYPKFVLKILAQLPVQSQLRIEKCKILMFLNYLCQLLHLKAADLKKKTYLPDIPESIKGQIMSHFFQLSNARGGSLYKILTSQQKDYLVAYIIVITLLVNQFSFLASDFISDLKLSQTKFSILVRAVGAKMNKAVVKGEKLDRVVLSLPLAEMNSRTAKRKR